jgi:hypothetical protein
VGNGFLNGETAVSNVVTLIYEATLKSYWRRQALRRFLLNGKMYVREIKAS